MTETASLPPPPAERMVSDVETLKALSDPLRVRILEAMVQAATEPWTVKRIAKTLGVGATKLYHHIKILEERELIRPAGQQLVRGIVETSYQIAQLSLRLDRRLLASGGDDVRLAAAEAITGLFDLAKRDLETAILSGLVPADPAGDPSRPFLLNRGLMRVSPERATEFRDRLVALCAEFDSDDVDRSVTLGFFISVTPLPGTAAKEGRR